MIAPTETKPAIVIVGDPQQLPDDAIAALVALALSCSEPHDETEPE